MLKTQYFALPKQSNGHNKATKSDRLIIWLIDDCILSHLWQYR